MLESDIWAASPWQDQRPVKTRGGLLGVLAAGFLGAVWASGRAGSGPGFPGASCGTPGPLQPTPPTGSVGRHSWLLSGPAGTSHGGFSLAAAAASKTLYAWWSHGIPESQVQI